MRGKVPVKNKSKKTNVNKKKNSTGVFIGIVFIFAVIVLIVVIVLANGFKAGFDEMVSAVRVTDGINYRSFVFSKYYSGNEKSPYPVFDSKENKYYFKNPANSNALTEKVYEDIRFPTGFYLNTETDKKYIAAVKYGGKWGYIYFSENESGKLVKKDGFYIEPIYDSAEPFYNEMAAVSKNGKYGFISSGGEIVIVPSYESVKYYSENLIPVKSNGLWYYLDINQKQVLGPYEDAESFSGGYACAKKDGLWGLIDKSGNFVVAAEFEDIWSVSNGGYHVFIDGKWIKKELS